ncbi:MAG: 30S ribosomal protein S15 [Bacteroidota bacterium]
MKLGKTQTAAICAKLSPKKSARDSGAPESQIGIFTHRINHLTQHLKVHRGDSASKVGLSRLIGKRKGLLAYLQREDIERYRTIVTSLGLRK